MLIRRLIVRRFSPLLPSLGAHSGSLARLLPAGTALGNMLSTNSI